ncbi:hypothetical protein KKE99_01260 [Patescibacteria group bacterium]|nr:hypothetical protein [Patescibacteria group bacterium]
MNKYILKCAIIGFIFGFLIIFIAQEAQWRYCPFEPFGNPDRWSDVCSLLPSGGVNKCIDNVFMVRSNCLSFLTFWGAPSDIPLIPNLAYALFYGLLGLLIGCSYSKFKK